MSVRLLSSLTGGGGRGREVDRLTIRKGYVMSITVTSLTKEETAYDKYIQFTYEGESYGI
jgi:hypothetical protein